MGRSSGKGRLHSETSLLSKQEKMMFPAHRLGSMNTPLHPLILTLKHIHLYSQKYEHIYFWTRWHTETPGSINVVPMKARTYGRTNTRTWVRWLQRRNKWSVHPEMIDLSAPPGMFYVQDVACPVMTSLMSHHGWATRFEALKMPSKLCCVLCVVTPNALSPQIFNHNIPREVAC